MSVGCLQGPPRAASRWSATATGLPPLLPTAYAVVVAWDIVNVGRLQIGELTVATETVAMVGLLLYAVMRAALHQPSRAALARHARPWLLACLAFWALQAVVWVAHGATAESGALFLRLPVFLLYAAGPVLFCTDRHELRPVLRAVVVAGVLLALAAAALGIPEPAEQGGDFRCGYVNPLGHALGLAVCVAYALLAAAERPSWRLRLTLLLLLGMLVATRSRGGMAATAAGCALIWWHQARPSARAFWTGVHALLLLGGCAMLATGLLEDWLVASGLLEASGSSNFFRLQVVVLAGRMLAESPLCGGGFGAMVNPNAALLDGLGSLPHGNIITSDNDYARLAGEAGLCGLLAVLVLQGACWWQWRAGRQAASGRPSRLQVLGAALAIYVFLLAGFEGVFLDPTSWSLLGLAFACLSMR